MVDRQGPPTPPSPYSAQRWSSAATLPLSSSPNLSNSNPKVDSFHTDVYPKIDFDASASDEERMNV